MGYKWGKRILFKVDAGNWRDSRRASISSSFSKVSSKERGGGLFRKRRGGIQCLETTCLNSRIESYGNSRQVFVESILVLSLVMVSHIFVPYFPAKTAIIFRAQAGGRLLKRGGEKFLCVVVVLKRADPSFHSLCLSHFFPRLCCPEEKGRKEGGLGGSVIGGDALPRKDET